MKEITQGPFKGMKIQFAESTQVERHKAALDTVIRMMADIADEDWTFDSVLITDQSSVNDFLQTPREACLLAQKLGFQIDRCEYLVDIALRMEPKQ